MAKADMVLSVIKEYGFAWVVNRLLYSAKVKLLKTVPFTEKLFEKKSLYPKKIDLFEIDIASLKEFIKTRLSEEEKTRLIKTADKACSGIIDGFSSIDLDYGNPIDWQINPITGIRCDERKKWFQIPDFDREKGDIKAVWEASRFSYFITLSRAYLLTDDEKYYRAFTSQLREWLEKNPYSYGANFKCGQECSIRMINTLLAFTVFKKSGIATDADTSLVKDLIDRCYRKVLSNFSYAYKCIKNNHTISELMGMIAGSWCCCDDWQLGKAYKLLDKVIDEQVTDDGGYCQFSFNYQRLALQDLEVVISMSLKTGIQLSTNSVNKIRKAALLMYQCQDVSGDMPNYGSNDGALIFPVTSCEYRDFRPVINTVFALTTGMQLYSDGAHQEELIWFSSNKNNLSSYKKENLERKASQFKNAGLFTIRYYDVWAMLVLNDYVFRPGHMHQLHFDLWVHGINVFCDAGSYSYASEEGKNLSKTRAHNTAVANGLDQMGTSGNFIVYGRPKRRLGECNATSFEGTCITVGGYCHNRKVKLDDNMFVITDSLTKDGEILFHTPCDVSVSGNAAVFSYNGKFLCSLNTTEKITLKESLRSLYYLKKEKSTCLAVKAPAGTEVKTTITIN